MTAETGSSEPLYNKHFSLGGHPVLPLLKELKHMVRDRNPKACRDMVKTIESLSHDSPYAGDIAILCDRVKRYQYKDAELALTSLINRMEGGTTDDRSLGLDPYGG